MALIQASDMDFYAYATRDLEPGEELTLPYGRPAGRPDHALFHYGFLPGGAGAAGAPPPLAALDLPGGGLHDTPTFSEEDHRAPAPAAPALAPGRISRALSACPCRSCAGAASALHLLGGSPYVMAPPRAPQSSAAARLHSGCRCPRRTRTARSASAAPVRQLRSRQAGLSLGRAAERTARRGVWTWQVWRQMARAALRRWAAACAAGLRVVPRLAGGREESAQEVLRQTGGEAIQHLLRKVDLTVLRRNLKHRLLDLERLLFDPWLVRAQGRLGECRVQVRLDWRASPPAGLTRARARSAAGAAADACGAGPPARAAGGLPDHRGRGCRAAGCAPCLTRCCTLPCAQGACVA